MNSQESLVLKTEVLPEVRLHATALFGILNNHSRREDRNSRVIGTLLGVQREGFIDITDSFGVPHLEKSDEVYVAINKDYHKSMYSFHRRIHRKEGIVGWYTTALPEGSLVIDNSTLIHDFYANECQEPIHLVVDTSLPVGVDSLNVKAYISEPMMVGAHAVANMFQEIKVDLVFSDSEKICLSHMTQNQTEMGDEGTNLLSTIPSQTESTVKSMELLMSLVEKISKYVDDVVSGVRTADPQVGILLADVMGSMQVVDPQDFQTYLADKTQDMLMVSYISSLTATQIGVAERLICLL